MTALQLKKNSSPEGSTLYKVFNIGNSEQVELEEFIVCIENSLGKKLQKNYMPINEGVDRFCKWYVEYKSRQVGNI